MTSRVPGPGSRHREVLNTYPLLGELSSEGRSNLLAAAAPLEAAKGGVLLREGDRCDPILLVTGGALRVFRSAVDGREISLYRVDPGDVCVLALCAVLDHRPYSATAIVAEPLTALGIRAATFRSLFEQEPALRRLAIESFSKRLEQTMTLVSEVAFARVDQRLAGLLLDRWQSHPAEDESIRVTHHELADELGTAREVVSRILRSFADDGLVELGRGWARVLDAHRLGALVPR